ncbi:MAG TPA: hypothetical protein VIR82_03365, partial [Bradyrhizobium sp.]
QAAAMTVVPIEQQRRAIGAVFNRFSSSFGFGDCRRRHPCILVSEHKSLHVMPRLVPGIHVFLLRGSPRREWPGVGERQLRTAMLGHDAAQFRSKVAT